MFIWNKPQNWFGARKATLHGQKIVMTTQELGLQLQQSSRSKSLNRELPRYNISFKALKSEFTRRPQRLAQLLRRLDHGLSHQDITGNGPL